MTRPQVGAGEGGEVHTWGCVAPDGSEPGVIGFLVAGLVIGSEIGGAIANLLGTGDVFELIVLGFIVSVVASVGLIIAAERIGIGAVSRRGPIGPGR